MSIEKIINGIIDREGGFVDNPSDPGDATRWGITEKVARQNGYRGDMHRLPRSTAYHIYHLRYVVGPNFDEVEKINPKIAEELIDTGVNCGPQRADKWLQTALNGLNQRQRAYANIGVDGDVGPATLEALKKFQARRGSKATVILLHALDALQGAHYLHLGSDDNARRWRWFVMGVPAWYPIGMLEFMLVR